MNNANSKTCSYLLKNPDTCQINLHLFFSARNPASIAPLSACIPPTHGCCRWPRRVAIFATNTYPRCTSQTRQPCCSPASHTQRSLRHIDPKTRDSFKSHSVTKSSSATAPGWSQPGRPAGAGDPAWDLQPSVPPLSRHISRAMIVGVSPALTMCVRKVVAGALVAGPDWLNSTVARGLPPAGLRADG